MMKTSLLRQAAAGRVALAARPARLPFRPSAVGFALSRPSQTAAVRRPIGSLLRFYSSESAAPETSDSDNGPITRFADLARLGVNPTLVSSITRGMGYENMTDVQSQTVQPALLGKDV